MTQQEARRILEATTRFDVRGGSVWLREVRWLRAVERQRREEATRVASQTAPASRPAPPVPKPPERRRTLAT